MARGMRHVQPCQDPEPASLTLQMDGGFRKSAAQIISSWTVTMSEGSAFGGGGKNELHIWFSMVKILACCNWKGWGRKAAGKGTGVRAAGALPLSSDACMPVGGAHYSTQSHRRLL